MASLTSRSPPTAWSSRYPSRVLKSNYFHIEESALYTEVYKESCFYYMASLLACFVYVTA